MNLIRYFTATSTIKKQVYLVLAILIVVVSLPVMAVFALGESTLSILLHNGSSNFSETGLYQGPPVEGDTYAWGNCTWWVYKLRLDAGDPIPNTWGNAADWALHALLEGYLVNHTPSVGSIMQTSDAAQGLGHVAYVTNVNPSNGDWTISEMNVKGLDIVDTQTKSALAALNYNFIHDKVLRHGL